MGLDDIFGGGEKQKFELPPEDEISRRARERIEKLSQEPLKPIPTRGIAEIQPLGEERTLARGAAKELLKPTEQPDFLSLPEVQATIGEIVAQGDLLANRLSRGLRKVGAFSSTPGRDVLGRATTDVSRAITRELGPQIARQRELAFADVQRRGGVAELLERFGLVEEERERVTAQAKFDAIFAKGSAEQRQVLTDIVPLLSILAGSGPQAVGFIQEAKPGVIEQAGAVASLGLTLKKLSTPTPAPTG